MLNTVLLSLCPPPDGCDRHHLYVSLPAYNAAEDVLQSLGEVVALLQCLILVYDIIRQEQVLVFRRGIYWLSGTGSLR